MASNINYQRKYWAVTYDQLSTIPIKAGNVISITDSDAIYYDTPNSLSDIQGPATRRKASSIKFINEATLPSVGEPEVIYIIQTTSDTIADDSKPEFSSFIWNVDSQVWVEIANNEHSDVVKTITDTDDGIYLVGSLENVDKTEHLIKNPVVYLRPTGDVGVYELNVNISGLAATADQANKSYKADSADRTEFDLNDQPILSYLHNVTQNGRNITFYDGEGNPLPTITTVDTTYPIYNASNDGIVPKLPTGVISTNLILTGDGWRNRDTISVGSANKSINDSAGNPITSTYVGNLALNGNALSIVKGNGDITTIDLPISSYNPYSGGGEGLVPADGLSDNNYLSGLGNWLPIPNYQVTTNSTNGLVPMPPSGIDHNILLGYKPNATTIEWLDTSITQVSSESTEDKIYVLGATTQTSESTTPYTNTNVYIENGVLSSDNGDYVTTNGSADLTNKTYDGFKLANACTKTVADTISDDESVMDNVPTVGAINNYMDVKLNPLVEALNSKFYTAGIAPSFGSVSSYNTGDYCIYEDTLYKCIHSGTSTTEFNESDWEMTNVMREIIALRN